MKHVLWEGDLSFGSCLDLQRFLLDSLDTVDDNLLEVRNLGKLDVAGLQVLVAARRWLEGLGTSLQVADNPEGKRINILAEKVGLARFGLKAVPHDD